MLKTNYAQTVNLPLLIVFLIGMLLSSPKAIGGEINIYSHRQPYLIEPFLKEFTKRTKIKTNVVFASKGLAQRLQAEGEASPADLVLTVDISRLKQYADKGLFQPFTSKALESSIPKNLRSKDNTWYGFSKRSRVIAVSKSLENSSNIKRFEDLTDTNWSGKICSRPGSHVYNRALLSSIIAANGNEAAFAWAQGLVENFARSPRGNDRSQIKAIFSGECAIALVNHYYYGKLINSEDPAHRKWAESVDIIIPNQEPTDRGAHINISGGGIAKHAKNLKEAKQFMEFLVSKEAQKLYASINYEYPVIAGVDLPDTLTAWGEFREDQVPIETLAELSGDAQKIIDKVTW
ncbi:MAG: extracellular solute-binding protein [Candidatus Puniceispirillaceae bacterium]